LRRWTLPCECFGPAHLAITNSSTSPGPVYQGCAHGKLSSEHELTTALSASAEKDLPELSSLGHFLKGSSATLGFNKVRDSCQVIQQYGHKQTLDGTDEPDEDVCLKKITDALKTVKVDFAELEKELKIFFNSDSETNED